MANTSGGRVTAQSSRCLLWLATMMAMVKRDQQGLSLGSSIVATVKNADWPNQGLPLHLSPFIQLQMNTCLLLVQL